jgi:hypothetical protein
MPDPGLTGREPLLDYLIPELTGLRLGTGKRITEKFPRGADVPVILLAGPRGIGKSAILDDLAHYAKHVPFARLDLADFARPELAVPSPLVTVLFRLTKRLAGPVDGQARLHCWRLNLGLAAVSAESLPPPRDEVAWNRSVELIKQAVGADDSAPPDWVTDYLPDVLSASPQDRRAALIKVAVAIIAGHLGSIRRIRHYPAVQAALRWYARRYPEADDGPDALVSLGERFNSGGNQRVQAEDELLEAFLADLRAAFFTALRAPNRIVRPLVLLENADCQLGVRLLKTLLVQRHRAAGEKMSPDPLVVVGAVHDITGFAEADNCDLDAVRYHAWRRGSEPASGAWTINLTPLSLYHVGGLFRGISATAIDPDLGYVAYRMTQGSPVGASELVGAVRREADRPDRDPGDRRITGSDLLTLRAADGDDDVLTALLRRLIPDAQARGGLVALALAEDADEADVIAEKCVGTNALWLTGLCKRVLRDQGWAEGDGFIGKPFLRTLLLAECRRSGTTLLSDSGDFVTTEQTWEKMATTLRDHYQATTPRGALRRRYHELTLASDLAPSAEAASAEAAAAGLRDAFKGTAAGEWLATVGTLGQAPYFGSLPHLRDVTLRHPAPGQDQLFLVVRRLLLTTWYLSDPRVAPDQELIGLLRHDLGALEEWRPGDGSVFGQARTAWPEAFGDGHCPVPRTWTGKGLNV